MGDQAEELREIMKNMSPKKEGKTRIITIASGKGGVGKTNISTNLAIAFAKLGKKVVVMDADLGLANVNVVLGVIPEFNLYHIVRKKKTMKEIIIKTKYGIDIVAGASGFVKVANLTDEERQNFIDQLKDLSYADIIIIDTAAGISSNVLSFIEIADDVLIVTTPEPTAITDAYCLIKIMSTEIEDKSMNLKLIVNRVQSVTEAKRVQQRVVQITNQFLNLKLEYLGYVYDDPIVSTAVRRQEPFLVLDPESRPSECLMSIASRMENMEYHENKGMSKLLKRFSVGSKNN